MKRLITFIADLYKIFIASDIFLATVLLLIAIALFGWIPIVFHYQNIEKKDAMEKQGLFDEHSLVHMSRLGTEQGPLTGDFFFGSGSINSGNAEPLLHFYWNIGANEIVSTTLPYSKFRFIIDDSHAVPTVRYLFGGHLCESITSDDANINDCIMKDGKLESAEIRISREILEREIYLPKIK